MLSFKNSIILVLLVGFILSFLIEQKAQPLSTSTPTQTQSNLTPASNSYQEDALEEYKNKNYGKARDIWLKGAEAGDKDAQHYLAVWYLMGEKNLGIEVDTPKGIALLEKAVSQNQHEAQRLLASAYMDGQWVEKDVEKSLALYEKSSMAGNAGASFDLATLYLNGTNIPKQERKALEYYKKSAAGNHSEAQMLLSTFYFKGEYGLTASNEKGLSLLERSAAQNNPTAQFLLALYMNEQKHDKVASYQWIKLALLNKPSSEAAIFIEKLKLSMTPEQIQEGERKAVAWKSLS